MMQRRAKSGKGLAALLLAASAWTTGSAALRADSEDTPASRELLERAYSNVRLEQVPTGILLEKGVIHSGDLALENNGDERERSPLSPDLFKTVYLDLIRASLGATLPSLEMLNATARAWREDVGATPIALAMVDYDTLSSGREPDLVDGVLQLPSGRLGETRRFVGALALADGVRSWAPDFVIPSNLLVLNGVGAEEIDQLQVQVGDAPALYVDLDRPFRPQWLPSRSGALNFSIAATVGDRTLTTRGIVPFSTPGKPSTDRPLPPPPTETNAPPLNPVACRPGIWHAAGDSGVERVRFWNLSDPVAGPVFVAPWDEATQTSSSGRLNVRVIPADNTSVRTLPGNRCVIELKNPLVLLDGLDVTNNRTNDTHLEAFGGPIKKALDLGFDVIMADYQNGRDWIQRNGRAFRSLMTVDLPNLVAQETLNRKGVAVLGRSMGTQVARWGLLEAEAMGLNHFTSLFISIDGPYLGANIPIGFQFMAVDLADQAPAAAASLASLESPAASQLLIRTFPRGADLWTSGWYKPRPEFKSYRDAVATLGSMPQGTRNVATAQGSGLGTPLVNGTQDIRLMRIDGHPGNSVASLKFWVEVRSDGPGSKVYEKRFCVKVFGLPINCERTSAVVPTGRGLDVTAGSFFPTTQILMQSIGTTLSVEEHSVDIDYSFDLDHHSHITPASAYGNVNWDNVTWEKCNTRHAFPTPTVDSLILSELVGLRDGAPPPNAPLFLTGCDIPEPRENCFPGVMWYENPDAPTFLRPWDNGAACYVTTYPEGLEGKVALDHYTVEPDILTCFDGGQPVGNGCRFTTVSGIVDYIEIPTTGLLHIGVIGSAGPSTCPANTSFLRVIGADVGPEKTVECEFLPVPGVRLSQLYISGSTVMAPADAQCGIGQQRLIDGEWLCYLGTAPTGTRPFEYNGKFYYDGWD